MHVVRRHLRFGAATWLVCHVLAFSALVPRDCCAARMIASAYRVPSARSTPMGAAAGRAAGQFMTSISGSNTGSPLSSTEYL